MEPLGAHDRPELEIDHIALSALCHRELLLSQTKTDVLKRFQDI